MKRWETDGVPGSADTSHHTVEQILPQAQNYHLQLFENLPVLIWQSGTDGLCNHFNRTWLEFTGRTPEQELGEGWAEGVHPDDLDTCITTYRSAFSERRSFAMEYRLRHHDGSYHWIADHGSPFNDLEGNFAGYIGGCLDINQQKMAEIELREAHEKMEQRVAERTLELQKSHNLLKSLSRQVPGVIFQFQMMADGSFRIPYASDSIREIYQIHPADVTENADTLLNRIHPDDYAPFLAAVQESARTLQPFLEEFRIQVPGKEFCWRSASAKPQRLDDGSYMWHGFSVDITERKRLDEELRDSRIKLNQAQHMAKMGSWHWFIDTNKLTWSEEMFVLTGSDPSKPPLPFSEQPQRYTPESRERLSRTIEHTLASGEPYELELNLVRPDNSQFLAIARGEAVIDENGRVVQLHGTLQDITEQRQLEKQLSQARTLESIGQLAAGVAHEVRNPLNAILSITEALFKESEIESDPEFQPYLQHIRTQVKRLAHLMNELLDLGKPIPASSLQPTPLYELCRETAVLWQSSGLAPNKWVVLTSDQTAAESYVMADGMKLQQVFFNLLENAGHHSPQGSKILFQLHCVEDGNAVIRVIDSGSGIADTTMDRIFDPFYSNRKGGTGLGLALVKHFVEHMGGCVNIRNNFPDPGCIAEIRIPLANEVMP